MLSYLSIALPIFKLKWHVVSFYFILFAILSVCLVWYSENDMTLSFFGSILTFSAVPYKPYIKLLQDDRLTYLQMLSFSFQH